MFDKNNLHHAYIIEGEKELIVDDICLFCENELLLNTKSNPDFKILEFDKFKVDDARKLRDLQMRKTIEDSRKIFVVHFNFITREAQNSLLKVLEEPTVGTHIFMITPTSKVFLDTVISRVVLLKFGRNSKESTATVFVKSTYAERFKIISKLVDDIKKEKVSKREAIILLKDLEAILQEDVLKNHKALKEIHKALDYVEDHGASLKNILEHIALVS